jgi:hypothetical protein
LKVALNTIKQTNRQCPAFCGASHLEEEEENKDEEAGFTHVHDEGMCLIWVSAACIYMCIRM